MIGVNTGGSSGGRKTIAHFMPWESIGGVEIATLRLIDVTSDRFRHVAFCKPNAVELRDAFEKAGVETVTYSPPEPSLRHAIRFYRQSRVVARDLKKVGANLVHFAETLAAYNNSLAAKLAGLPLLCHVRSRYSTLSLREKICFFPIDRYVFVSQESRRQFAIQLPDRRANVVRDAIALADENLVTNRIAVREEFQVPDGATLIGMVARVNPQKDYFTLAAAAAQVVAVYPNTKFLIVGDNSLVELNRHHYSEVSAKLAELRISDSFIFAGFRTDVSRLLSAMDIFVLCTHREGLPLAILEAMSMQKPVVATAVDGIPEMIANGVTGYLHAHSDSNGLAEILLKLVHDPSQGFRVGASARELIKENYTFETFAKSMGKIYDEMIQKSK